MAETIFDDIVEVVAAKDLANRKIAFVESIKCTAAERTDRPGSYKITFSQAHPDGDKK